MLAGRRSPVWSYSGEDFVGRTKQLKQLSVALQASEAGKTSGVFLRGAPGMGKTALVHRFVRPSEKRDCPCWPFAANATSANRFLSRPSMKLLKSWRSIYKTYELYRFFGQFDVEPSLSKTPVISGGLLRQIQVETDCRKAQFTEKAQFDNPRRANPARPAC
jgi:hypothetical protein